MVNAAVDEGAVKLIGPEAIAHLIDVHLQIIAIVLAEPSTAFARAILICASEKSTPVTLSSGEANRRPGHPDPHAISSTLSGLVGLSFRNSDLMSSIYLFRAPRQSGSGSPPNPFNKGCVRVPPLNFACVQLWCCPR